VHHRVHVPEGGGDRFEIADVGLMAVHPGQRPAVQRAQGPAPVEAAPDRLPDEPAHPGDQDPSHRDDDTTTSGTP
jgi:hypothetical protein